MFDLVRLGSVGSVWTDQGGNWLVTAVKSFIVHTLVKNNCCCCKDLEQSLLVAACSLELKFYPI
jgi:hypothetical protein